MACSAAIINMSIIQQLPQQFVQFLKAEGIDTSMLEMEQTVRYVRLKEGSTLNPQQLKEQISEMIKPTFIPNIYAIPSEHKIASNQLYQNGSLFGIDYSSAAVVEALGLNAADTRILEICCAPGAKLTFIADKLRVLTERDNQPRKVFGLDVNANRLKVTQSIVNKYNLQGFIELILGDGTTYGSEVLFDKVLVDAECTHEGSVKHLKKFVKPPQNSKRQLKDKKASEKQLKLNHTNHYLQQQTKANEWSEQDFIDRFLDKKKLDGITELQYKLLENGFRLVKANGILVYSTCSFSRKQNEDIISRFLEEHQDATLCNVFPEDTAIVFRPGLIDKTVRFDPQVSNSGGMFIAKVQKIKQNL